MVKKGTNQKHMNPVKKILIMAANPKNTPRLRFDEEVREIKEGLRLSKYGDQFEIHSELAVRFRDIRRALLEHKPQIVHFIGHGEKKGLMVEDKLGVSVRFSSKVLSGLFKLFSDQVECVILSACYSVRQAAAINKHINYVIGMKKEITDKAAIEFAVGFYDALGAGESIEKAFEFGCNAIEFLDLPNHLLPVLKMKKDLDTSKGKTGTLTKKFSVPISSQPPPHSQSIPHTTSREENVEIQVNVKDRRKVIVNICISLIVLITVFVFIYRYLIGPSNNKIPESEAEVVEQLLSHLNTRLPGSQFKTDPIISIVKPVGKNRYQITLKNAYFSTDLAWTNNLFYKHLSSGDSPYIGLDTSRMEEVVIVYGPGENYLSLRSIKGMSLEHEFSKSPGTNQSSRFGGFNMKRIRVSVGKITFDDLDINQLINYDKRDFTEVISGPGLVAVQPSESTLEHLKLEISGLTARKDVLSIILDIEKIGSVDEGKEDYNISAYMLDKDAPPPDLKDTLEKGLAINDLKIQLGKVNLLIKKNGIKEGDGIMDHASYSQFMKPDENRKSFQLGHGIEIKNFKLSLANKKEIQLLSRVKEFQYGFSMKRLSPTVVQTFLDLTKKGFTSRDLVDSTKMTDFTSLAMKLWLEVMNSRPQIQFSISLKHYFGDLDATAEIYLHNLLSGPILKITVDIFKVDDILNRLREANVFSDSTLQQIEQFLEKHAVKKENGDASIIYEMDIHQLRQMFLKGNPLVAPSTHNPFDFWKH